MTIVNNTKTERKKKHGGTGHDLKSLLTMINCPLCLQGFHSPSPCGSLVCGQVGKTVTYTLVFKLFKGGQLGTDPLQ